MRPASLETAAADAPPPGGGPLLTGRRRWVLLAQVSGSALVLALLVEDAQWARVWGALTAVSLPWLLLAMGAKALGVTVRELRLWVALTPWGRPPFSRVLAIGYTTGLVNNVVPARGGDLLGAALLRLECGVGWTAALAAVGITSLLEAVVFALWLLGLLGAEAPRWRELAGVASARQTLGWLSLVTLAAVLASVLVVVLGRRLQRGDPARPVSGPGPLGWLRMALVDAGRGLGALRPLLANLGLAALQVACMVGTYLSLFPALGLQVGHPLLAASLVLAVGSVVAVALPPTLAAGNAATAVGVLALFAVEPAAAVAFGALIWLAHCLPILALGAWPLWARLGRLSALGAAP